MRRHKQANNSVIPTGDAIPEQSSTDEKHRALSGILDLVVAGVVRRLMQEQKSKRPAPVPPAAKAQAANEEKE